MKAKQKKTRRRRRTRGSRDETDDGQSEDLPSRWISAAAKTPLNHPRGEPRQNKAGRRVFRISSSAEAPADQIRPGLCLCNPPARYPRRPASTALKMLMRATGWGIAHLANKACNRFGERQMYQQPDRQICLLFRGRLGPTGTFGAENM